MQVQPIAAMQLNTSITEQLHLLEKKFLAHKQQINDWFEEQWQKTLPPVYGSVDLRNAGFKVAPIDMNLFPAGFNNLNPKFLDSSVHAAKKIIYRIAPNAKNILILPEGHTRNLYYWANIKTLQKILEKAGFEIRFGDLSNEIVSAQTYELPSDEKLIIEPIKRESGKLFIDHFKPDLILLNNDLSEGIPDILQNLTQPIIPPAQLGWSTRLKSDHFKYYADVTNEFAKLIDIDSWLIAPLFQQCGKIDFMQQDGLECLTENVDYLFAELKKKYAEYQIPYQPFLIVKADAGTYGMAVMTVRHADDLKGLNRKQRTRMAFTKGSQPVRSVIIQEGVYTFEALGKDNAVAEPVVYLWGDCVVGGFYRVHSKRGVDENLNTPGMQFEPIAFSQSCNEPDEAKKPDALQNRFFIYGIIAKLSMLAAAREIKDQDKNDTT